MSLSSFFARELAAGKKQAAAPERSVAARSEQKHKHVSMQNQMPPVLDLSYILIAHRGVWTRTGRSPAPRCGPPAVAAPQQRPLPKAKAYLIELRAVAGETKGNAVRPSATLFYSRSASSGSADPHHSHAFRGTTGLFPVAFGARSRLFAGNFGD